MICADIPLPVHPKPFVFQEKQNDENGDIIITNGDTKDLESKGQMVKMKHMGQLWLAAEVRALESRVRGKASLSPFLVLDCDALIKYTYMVKHLVNSRKFIVVVPSAGKQIEPTIIETNV